MKTIDMTHLCPVPSFEEGIDYFIHIGCPTGEYLQEKTSNRKFVFVLLKTNHELDDFLILNEEIRVSNYISVWYIHNETHQKRIINNIRKIMSNQT